MEVENRIGFWSSFDSAYRAATGFRHRRRCFPSRRTGAGGGTGTATGTAVAMAECTAGMATGLECTAGIAMGTDVARIGLGSRPLIFGLLSECGGAAC